MTTAFTDRNHLSSSRLGFSHRRLGNANGYRLPARLIDGSRLIDLDLRACLSALRGSRLEAGAPERL